MTELSLRQKAGMAILNFREYRIFQAAEFGVLSLIIVGAAAGVEEAVTSEKGNIVSYATDSLEGLALGIIAGAAFYGLMRTADYLIVRNKRGILDTGEFFYKVNRER